MNAILIQESASTGDDAVDGAPQRARVTNTAAAIFDVNSATLYDQSIVGAPLARSPSHDGALTPVFGARKRGSALFDQASATAVMSKASASVLAGSRLGASWRVLNDRPGARPSLDWMLALVPQENTQDATPN